MTCVHHSAYLQMYMYDVTLYMYVMVSRKTSRIHLEKNDKCDRYQKDSYILSLKKKEKENY